MQKHKYKDTETIQPLKHMIVSWDNYRFTVLTDSMIRIEYSPDNQFVDAQTKIVMNRKFSEVNFDCKETDKFIEIVTKHVRLIFQKEKGGFTESNLSAEMLGNYSSYHSKWYYGQEFETLKGTARTLDHIDGSLPLDEGLMNMNGYSIIDDSRTVIIKDDGWIIPKLEQSVDIYFLGYGRNYIRTLKDYFHLTGHPPLIPRYALGNWWSRFYPYSDETYKELINKFEIENIPFSVSVLDMDWHLTDIPDEYGSGWTGYTWNRELFPDPPAFLDWLHSKGLKTSLNLHPAHGVQPHEEIYEEMSCELGIDPEKKIGIEFDITDNNFMNAYFKYLHHPLEEEGTDFWWIDWQQGSVSKFGGVDPLWVLNHYHFQDHGRDGKRPLIFSRYAGLGSHRYPLGFSGDSITTWDSLDFQPYFTATASNVGYTWWSHDIGGHMRGIKDRELYIRWIQFGVFSPINRLHSTGGKYNGKEPWRYGVEANTIASDYLRLRHQMVPYLYSMNVLTNKEGIPLIQPMYYHHPWDDEAYSVKNQYYFGSELVVTPITTKVNPLLQRSHVKTWLPKGLWYDYFSGVRYTGGRLIDMYRPLDKIPVLAKAGGIVPINRAIENDISNPNNIELAIFAGDDGRFDLLEDTGKTPEFDGAATSIKFDWHANGTNDAILEIFAPKEKFECLPNDRKFKLKLVGFVLNEKPLLFIDGENHLVEYSSQGGVHYLELPVSKITSHYKIEFSDVALRLNKTKQLIENILDDAQIEFDLKEKIDKIVNEEDNQNFIIGRLLSIDLDTELVKSLTEILLAEPK